MISKICGVTLQINQVWIGGDKILHLVLAFILSFLSMMSLFCTMSWWKILAVLMVIISIEETMQIFLPNRYFGFNDLLAGWSGLICGAILHKLLKLINKLRYE